MSSKTGPSGSVEITLESVSLKLEQLEEQVAVQSKELEELKGLIPDSNIISPKFLNRAFAVWGHYVVAGFIIAIPFMCLTGLFAILIMLFSQQQY